MDIAAFLTGLVLLAVAAWFWAADSRPGAEDSRTERPRAWFPH